LEFNINYLVSRDIKSMSLNVSDEVLKNGNGEFFSTQPNKLGSFSFEHVSNEIPQ